MIDDLICPVGENEIGTRLDIFLAAKGPVFLPLPDQEDDRGGLSFL